MTIEIVHRFNSTHNCHSSKIYDWLLTHGKQTGDFSELVITLITIDKIRYQ